jgi:hypothetical protein
MHHVLAACGLQVGCTMPAAQAISADDADAACVAARSYAHALLAMSHAGLALLASQGADSKEIIVCSALQLNPVHGAAEIVGALKPLLRTFQDLITQLECVQFEIAACVVPHSASEALYAWRWACSPWDSD